MEFSDDFGLGWRLDARKILAPLGIKCIIPNEEESQWIENPEDFARLKTENLSEYLRVHRAFMKQDLDFTLDCDYFICKWEGERIHGTTGEAQWRWQNGKDAYLITSKPVAEVPGWFLASFSHMFSSTEQLAEWLEKQETDDDATTEEVQGTTD
jgi:hypothetical protein